MDLSSTSNIEDHDISNWYLLVHICSLGIAAKYLKDNLSLPPNTNLTT